MRRIGADGDWRDEGIQGREVETRAHVEARWRGGYDDAIDGWRCLQRVRGGDMRCKVREIGGRVCEGRRGRCGGALGAEGARN